MKALIIDNEEESPACNQDEAGSETATTELPVQPAESDELTDSTEWSELLAATDRDLELAAQQQAVQSERPEQHELPFAVVAGQPIINIPKDLYIPPAALEIFLEAFEGPLDFLLYLIRHQNIDILDINVSEITDQYMQYVELMDAVRFELAAEYLVMAAMLAEIKSRMLLPRADKNKDDEDDPRAQLIRRLLEYERFKKVAEDIDILPRIGRDIFQGNAEPPDYQIQRPQPQVDLKEILVAFAEVLKRAELFESHHVRREQLSTRERMTRILSLVSEGQFIPFISLFTVAEGRMGVVVTFLAMMELIKESLIEVVQTELFGPIHIHRKESTA